MKKIILSCVALMATFFCASTVSAQGVKIYKVGGEVIDIPAAQLDYIEAYDAASETPSFEGTWKMKKLIADKEAMDNAWWGSATFGDAYPSFDANDEITFQNGRIVPNFQSTLKNFFIGEATYEIVENNYQLRIGMFDESVALTLLKVKGVNRFFDADKKSEDDEAFIGVRMVEDEDADEAGIYDLEIYLIDYNSTSFAPEFNDFYIYNNEKPTATVSGSYINFLMSKANSSEVRRKVSANTVDSWEAFNSAILSNNYSVVFFNATWCGPGVIANLVLTNHMNSLNNIGYVKVMLGDDDFSAEISQNYSISALPTILIVNQLGYVQCSKIGVPDNAFLNTITNYSQMANTADEEPADK